MDTVQGRATGQLLLQIAKHSLRVFILEGQWYRPLLEDLPALLCERASSFVTLYRHEELRGCIGSTGARYPLAVDVARNAAAAARDPRFLPVGPQELPAITLEISVISPALPIMYDNYKDLLGKLRPGEDGVIISWQEQRALLLPQVWARLREPAEFLHALCQKARIPLQVLQAIPPAVTVMTFEAYLVKENDDTDWS